MRLKITALAVLGLFFRTAFAFEPFTVQKIRVEGIERTEAGTVLTYLPIHEGDTVDDAKAQQAISSLFATGFFSDVRIDIDGKELIVVVQERPIIGQLTFKGIKDFPEDELRKSLKNAGLAEARVFDQSLLDGAIQELRRQYYNRGKYSVQLDARVTPLDKGRVDILIEASEGVTAKIRSVNILGNQAFTESKLLGRLSTTTGSWWNPFSSASQYSKAKLQADEEALRSYYQNRGYIEFDLRPTQVAISSDKKDVFVSFALEEGAQYRVGDVSFSGEKLLSDAEMENLLGLKKGDVFSRESITKGISRIVDRLGDDGFAFANVNAIPDLDKKTNTANFTIVVDPGRRVYVNRININGNVQTRDEVIRRELRQMESAPYSSSKIKRSKTRLDMLGFFSEVNVQTPPVAGTNDQVNVNVDVKEKETGNFLFGAGFSQGQGIVLNASVSQNNFFGTGNRVELKLNGSKLNRVYSLSFTDPYWTTDGVSRSFDIYQRYVDPTSVDLGAYTTETIGGRVRFGVPISETNRIYYGLGYESQKMKLYDNSPERYFDFVESFGDKYETFLGTIGWSSDSRDSYLAPTSGTYKNLSLEAGFPPADIRYIKASYQHQWFYPITNKLTLMANGELGWAKGHGDQGLPFFLNFYAGGVSSVRGYEAGSLGPRDRDNALGGDRRVVGNLELFFPMPGMEDDDSVRLSAFTDGGWVYGRDADGNSEKLDLGQLRYSAGVSMTWYSPVGPLKFSLAKALNDKEDDQTETFQFQLGNVF